MSIDFSKVITAEAKAASDLAAWRATAKMSRTDFCLALAGAGILTGAEAVSAARGDVPASFEPLVSAMPDQEALEARIRWAAMTEVERLNPFIATVAAASSIPDAALDEIFGR